MNFFPARLACRGCQLVLVVGFQFRSQRVRALLADDVAVGQALHIFFIFLLLLHSSSSLFFFFFFFQADRSVPPKGSRVLTTGADGTLTTRFELSEAELNGFVLRDGMTLKVGRDAPLGVATRRFDEPNLRSSTRA